MKEFYDVTITVHCNDAINLCLHLTRVPKDFKLCDIQNILRSIECVSYEVIEIEPHNPLEATH